LVQLSHPHIVLLEAVVLSNKHWTSELNSSSPSSSSSSNLVPTELACSFRPLSSVDEEALVSTVESKTPTISYLAELCEMGSLEEYLLAESKGEKELSDQDRLRLCFELFSGFWFLSFSPRFFVNSPSLPSGVDYLCDVASVVHCDLKPANLLLTKEKRLKITDFNLASDFSLVNSRNGTKRYMSPERLFSQKWVRCLLPNFLISRGLSPRLYLSLFFLCSVLL
jgi:serine/threonine protein kinase